jgi:hypothetical protein
VHTIQEIEKAVADSSPKSLAEFRAWFAKFDADRWDTEFERDVKAGKLDALADEALAEFKAGKCREL